MVYVFALGAGLFYALASVFQQRAASAQPPSLSLRPRLIIELFKAPIWLLGLVLDGGAYLLEAAALAVGSIVVVQPLLVSGLLFALPLSAIGASRKPGHREWAAAVAVTAGLAVFVTVGSPGGGTSQAPIADWLVVVGLCAAAASAAVLGAREAPPHRRAMLLAFSAGCVYGCTAAFTKSAVDLLGDEGVPGLLTSWQAYALAASFFIGLLLNQSAFHAGHLAASLPALAVTDPVISCIVGVTLFGEELGATGALAITVTIVAIVVMVVGTVALARSPLVTHEEEGGHPPLTPAGP